MTGPSGWLTLTVLVVVFLGAIGLMLRLRSWYARAPLVLVAFLAAGLTGMSAVNGYYAYYASWGSLVSDLQADNGAAASPATFAAPSPAGSPSPHQAWRVVRLVVPGPVSGVRGRFVDVVLPPGFSTATADRLPVLELLHGNPGQPSSWTNSLDIAHVLARQDHPMVVVLPDLKGAFTTQQCLDAVGGPRLSTWLTADVPADLEQQLHVVKPGPRWVIGGLSEGGFCSAELALAHPGLWSGVASMDGYFHPEQDATFRKRIAGPVSGVDPTDLLLASTALPHFWIMAGTGNASDYADSVRFGRLVERREPFRFVSVIGGRHNALSWRAALPDLLTWAWNTANGSPTAGTTQLRPT